MFLLQLPAEILYTIFEFLSDVDAPLQFVCKQFQSISQDMEKNMVIGPCSMYIACKRGHTSLAVWLHTQGIALDSKLFTTAVLSGNTSMCEYLCDAKCPSAFEVVCAIKSESTDMIQMILSKGFAVPQDIENLFVITKNVKLCIWAQQHMGLSFHSQKIIDLAVCINAVDIFRWICTNTQVNLQRAHDFAIKAGSEDIMQIIPCKV